VRDLVVDGKTSEWILGEDSVKFGTGFIWLRTGTSDKGGCTEMNTLLPWKEIS
jgi:hypothetical protein